MDNKTKRALPDNSYCIHHTSSVFEINLPTTVKKRREEKHPFS
jgi:hypothetical protein